MKLLTYLLLASSLVFPSVSVWAVPYDDDEQNFWVDGQDFNEDLEAVNFLICIGQAVRSDAFVNAGPYIAALYPADCETGAGDAAADKKSATASSSKSSSTASSSTATVSAEKITTMATMSVTRLDNNPATPVKGSGWLIPAPEEGSPPWFPEIKVYIGLNQSAGVSADNPNGVFEFAYSSLVSGSGGEAYGFAPGTRLGGAHLKVTGTKMELDEHTLKISVEFLDNGDKRGVTYKGQGIDGDFGLCDYAVRNGIVSSYDDCEADVDTYFPIIKTETQFYLSKSDKTFCQKLASAEHWRWDTSTEEEGDQVLKEVIDLTGDLSDWDYAGLSVNETCFTTDRKKAQRNVHRYGTYIDGGAGDGKRLPVTAGAFPLFADVTNGDGDPQRIHAWADYWGVWVERDGRSLVNSSTPFYKENDDSSSPEAYNVTPSDLRIEKRETTYIALNEIDGLTLRWWAGDAKYDADWATQYSSLLGGSPSFDEYEGKFNKDTSTVTLTKGIKFENGYSEEALASPISFTLTDWTTKMVIKYGTAGDDWYFEDKRSLGVWSTDTHQWYEISAETMGSPSSATKAAGVRTETSSTISASDLTETLYCFRECLDGVKVQETFTQAVVDGATSVSSPFADVGGGLKEAVTITRAYSDRDSMSEATDNFWLTDNTLEANGLKLGEGTGAAVTDFVNGAPDVQTHTAIDLFAIEGCIDDAGCTARYSLSGQGLSKTNLNKLLAGDSANPGKVPVFNLNIRSIPTAGTSGSMKIKVRVLEVGGSDGEQTTLQAGERALEAETTVNYVSDGSQFKITIPGGAQIDLTYFTTGGTALQGSFTKGPERTFAYAGGAVQTGSVAGQSGLSWDFFELFTGHSGISGFSNAGVNSFFETDKEYVALMGISNTSLAVKGPGSGNDASFQDMEFYFRAKDDSALSYTQEYPAGSDWQGVIASEIYSYSLQSGKILDGNDKEITKGATASNALSASEDPYNLLQNVTYPNTYGDNANINWGVRTGQLVGASDLSKMECPKYGKDQSYEWHPIHGESTDVTRYCEFMIWEGDVSTTYTISLETDPSYSIVLASTQQKVVIDQPKVLYYSVPETLDDNGQYVFGDDHGKQIRLEYQGHGELHGIPGFVYDTETGEDKGEFVNDWKETYRYLARFTIPDGGLLTDPTDGSASFKVKALDGEEWLTPADGTVSGVNDMRGRYTSQYWGTKSDLLNYNSHDTADGSIPQPHLPSDSYYIGVEPTSGLLNNGNASVVHGEVVFTPGD